MQTTSGSYDVPALGGEISKDEWLACLDHFESTHADIDLPRLLLWDLHTRLSPPILQEAIHQVWIRVSGGLVDLPGAPRVDSARSSRLTPDDWKILFRAAGGYFAIEESDGDGFGGNGCPKPRTLFRYSEDAARIGWAWTATPQIAAAYETSFAHDRREGHLWRVDDIDPDRLLAHFHTERLAQAEGLKNSPSAPVYVDEFIFEPHSDEIVRHQDPCLI